MSKSENGNAVASSAGLEHKWRQPPPGMAIIKDGAVKRGDYFYIVELGAWGPVPRIGWGEPIRNSLIARGTLIGRSSSANAKTPAICRTLRISDPAQQNYEYD